jgi:hypothetical protein
LKATAEWFGLKEIIPIMKPTAALVWVRRRISRTGSSTGI